MRFDHQVASALRWLTENSRVRVSQTTTKINDGDLQQ